MAALLVQLKAVVAMFAEAMEDRSSLHFVLALSDALGLAVALMGFARTAQVELSRRIGVVAANTNDQILHSLKADEPETCWARPEVATAMDFAFIEKSPPWAHR